MKMGSETATARRQGEDAGARSRGPLGVTRGSVGLTHGFVCGALAVLVVLHAAAGHVFHAFILADTFLNAY